MPNENDDEPTSKSITIWLCPICHVGQLYENWQKHVRDEHPGHVIKEIHPAKGHA